jgi:hypothetical protein
MSLDFETHGTRHQFFDATRRWHAASELALVSGPFFVRLERNRGRALENQ